MPVDRLSLLIPLSLLSSFFTLFLFFPPFASRCVDTYTTPLSIPESSFKSFTNSKVSRVTVHDDFDTLGSSVFSRIRSSSAQPINQFKAGARHPVSLQVERNYFFTTIGYDKKKRPDREWREFMTHKSALAVTIPIQSTL
jgi:hypothetical protein